MKVKILKDVYLILPSTSKKLTLRKGETFTIEDPEDFYIFRQLELVDCVEIIHKGN